jgi:hypothetical protein
MRKPAKNLEIDGLRDEILTRELLNKKEDC